MSTGIAGSADLRTPNRRQISRQIKFPLRPHGSRKQSALIVDDAESSFFHTIEPCREYLYRNVDAITKEWGVVHGVEKHDVS